MKNIKAAIIGAGIGLGILASIFGPDASTSIAPDPIQEDSDEWRCATMGDHVCGPTNTEGMVAGCYDHEGVLVVMWPCESWRA